ncbi:MAG: phosphoadenylyl-sulfate reductase [Flavobacteriales bacterium]
MEIEEKANNIIKKLQGFANESKSLFATTSLQSHSIPLLHMISKVQGEIPVFFLNTGYHFPETLKFRDELKTEYGIDIRDLYSFVPKNQQRDDKGRLFFVSDPDHCCYLNKIQPLEPILANYDIWVNGIRADQNINRRNMKEFQETPEGAMRYHPLLNWTSKMIHDYRKIHELPKHPLEDKGFFSISCEPCTRRMSSDDLREGRWYGLNKTECGLHTDLVKDKGLEN